MMRILAIILYCCVLSIMTAFGQKVEQDRTVYKSKITGFAGPMMSFGQIEYKPALFWGVSGALFLDKQFFFGGYSTSLASIIEKNIIGTPKKANILFGHGGIWTGYVFFPSNAIHFSTSLQAGWGGVSLHETTEIIERNEIFAITPQFELNIHYPNWLKINLSLGYSYVGKMNSMHLNTKHYRTPMGSFGILISDFWRSKRDDRISTARRSRRQGSRVKSPVKIN